MPLYNYKSKNGISKEVFHSMCECDKPSEKTLKEITLPTGEIMVRTPSLPNLVGFQNGTSMKPNELGNARRADNLKRSSKDFKKNVLPTLSGTEAKAHEKRLKEKGV